MIDYTSRPDTASFSSSLMTQDFCSSEKRISWIILPALAVLVTSAMILGVRASPKRYDRASIHGRIDPIDSAAPPKTIGKSKGKLMPEAQSYATPEAMPESLETEWVHPLVASTKAIIKKAEKVIREREEAANRGFDRSMMEDRDKEQVPMPAGVRSLADELGEADDDDDE